MILSWIGASANWLQRSTSEWLTKIKLTVFRLIVMLTFVALLLWISIFFYGSFYYVYMPAISHVKPVHLQFKTNCDSSDETCGFPSANLSLVAPGRDQLQFGMSELYLLMITILNKLGMLELLQPKQLLLRGQPYKVILEIEMPESPVNQLLGMFMVKLDFYSHYGQTVQSSSRAAMLHYKSPLLQALDTYAYAPFLVFGAREQKQLITVEFYNHYLDDAYKPCIGAHIQVQAKKVEIYSTMLKIYADFTGLRYLMFNHPILCAISGISSNMVFLTAVALLSWYRFFFDASIRRVPSPESSQPTLEERRRNARAALERESSSRETSEQPSTSTTSGMLPYGAEQEPVVIDTSKKRVKKTFLNDPDRSMWGGGNNQEPETIKPATQKSTELEDEDDGLRLKGSSTVIPSAKDSTREKSDDTELRRRVDTGCKT